MKNPILTANHINNDNTKDEEDEIYAKVLHILN